MLRKILSFLTVIALSIGFIGTTNTVSVKAELEDFDCNYSATKDLTTNLGYFGAGEIIHYTEEEAAAAGVPAGFSGDVLKVIGKGSETSMGVLCDFSHLNIPTSVIQSITFTVYVANDANTTDAYPEIRIPKPYNMGDWTMRYYDIKDHIAEWHDVVYTGSLDSISKNGYLDKFEVALRHQNITDFYIDSIKINYVEDTTAPVITFNGENNVTISEGQSLIFDVSAIDAVYGEVDIEYVWGDPSKLDDSGNPLAGEHTLTFKATDYFGNTAEYTINVTVVEPDLVAPEFSIPTNEIFVKIGTTPLINVVAFDDINGEVEVVQTWSENALDQYGKLTEGTHVLTLTATDASNNQTVKTITFYVTETGDTFDVVVDEEVLCPEESEEESEEESSSELESEEESEEESTSEVESEEESESQSEEESTSEVESEEESESQSEEESQKESVTTSEKESEKESEEESNSEESDSEESKATATVSCKGSLTAIPFLSLLTLAGAVTLFKKKKQ